MVFSLLVEFSSRAQVIIFSSWSPFLGLTHKHCWSASYENFCTLNYDISWFWTWFSTNLKNWPRHYSEKSSTTRFKFRPPELPKKKERHTSTSNSFPPVWILLFFWSNPFWILNGELCRIKRGYLLAILFSGFIPFGEKQ